MLKSALCVGQVRFVCVYISVCIFFLCVFFSSCRKAPDPAVTFFFNVFLFFALLVVWVDDGPLACYSYRVPRLCRFLSC